MATERKETSKMVVKRSNIATEFLRGVVKKYCSSATLAEIANINAVSELYSNSVYKQNVAARHYYQTVNC